jgi:hypothetical protein
MDALTIKLNLWGYCADAAQDFTKKWPLPSGTVDEQMISVTRFLVFVLQTTKLKSLYSSARELGLWVPTTLWFVNLLLAQLATVSCSVVVALFMHCCSIVIHWAVFLSPPFKTTRNQVVSSAYGSWCYSVESEKAEAGTNFAIEDLTCLIRLKQFRTKCVSYPISFPPLF